MTVPAMDELVSAILEGDSAQAVRFARELYSRGVTSREIVVLGVEPAMSALDAKCTVEQFNLLEIMLSGRAVTEVMKTLYPAGIPTTGERGTVVVATLQGDVHDLGKNILKMVLMGSGFRVVDCGKDCPLGRLADAAESERPLAVAVSGLITQVIPMVRQVRDEIRARGLECVKVIAGGAALKQSTAEHLNVDFVADSAFDGLHFIEALTQPGERS
jgi:methanogenic corrinoid protein MtbC1